MAKERTQVLLAMELCVDSLHGARPTSNSRDGAPREGASARSLSDVGLLFEARLRLGGALRSAMLREVAEGMAFLHSRGVLHRDLKPENVLVKAFDEDAQTAACKLADFGLSTNTSASLARSNLTLTAMIGTPLYMAPELMTNAARVRYGPKADVSLCATPYWGPPGGRAVAFREPDRGPLL